MDKNRTLEFYVGIFVFLGFAAMLFMALQAANLGSFTGSGKTISVTAAFDNIGGLKARAAVKSAGVVVGRVQSVVFDPESFQAKVTMDLDAAYPFPADSSAKILTSGLLGEQYVGLEAGADEENLKNGDEKPGDQGGGSGQFHSLHSCGCGSACRSSGPRQRPFLPER